MSNPLWTSVAWVLAACVLGFAISMIFAGIMKLRRSVFLIPYVGLVAAFLAAFVVANKIDVVALLAHNWVGGLIIGILVSLFLIRQVRSQPASRQMTGVGLALEITWAGLLYGLADALFLNVMPVVAIWAGTAQFGWDATPAGRIAEGLLELLASLTVAFCYHLGYPEFHGERMRYVFIGNGIITLAFPVSGNPLGAMIAHAAMHIAAVLQGAETTVQLPPHYSVRMVKG